MKQIMVVVILLAALALSATPALAQDAAPDCHTTQTASAVCDGAQVVVKWTAGNYWGYALSLQVQAIAQYSDHTLLDGQSANGTFASGKAQLPAGAVTFVWALAMHPSGFWTETVNYPAVSCVPAAVRVGGLRAWRLW